MRFACAAGHRASPIACTLRAFLARITGQADITLLASESLVTYACTADRCTRTVRSDWTTIARKAWFVGRR